MENDKCRRREKGLTRRTLLTGNALGGNAKEVIRKYKMGTCSKSYTTRKTLTKCMNNLEGAPRHHTPHRVS
jgi:hypothetical protein